MLTRVLLPMVALFRLHVIRGKGRPDALQSSFNFFFFVSFDRFHEDLSSSLGIFVGFTSATKNTCIDNIVYRLYTDLLM